MPSDRRLRAILLATALSAAVIAGPAWAAAPPGLGAAAAVTATPASVSAPAAGTTPGPQGAAAPEQVLVRFRSGTRADERRRARGAADADFVEPLPLAGLQLVDPEPGMAVRETVAQLERSPAVLYAEPNVIRTNTAVPNDDFFDRQWGLDNTGQSIRGTVGAPDADMDAPEAWELETGSASVPVGVLDSGVETAHPDLAPNIWRNPREIPGNGIDDDGNGLKDDVSGWDWVDDDNVPEDLDGHGTHVAGTIAARGNDETGVTGVAWQAGIVPLRVLGADGSGSVGNIIKGYAYAQRNGIKIVNASLGGRVRSNAERDALAAAPDVLVVAAAGNDGADNDGVGSYPCNYDLANVVCVAASDQSDALAGFSNYGSTTVDLAAPGVSIASTYPDFERDCQPDWVYLDGTSMATPQVAGVAALAWSLLPSPSVAGVRAALLDNVDVKPSLAGRVATGGRLNAYRALGGASGTPVTPPPATAPATISCPASAPPATPSTAPQPLTSPAPTPTPAPTPSPTTAPSEPAEVAATHRPGSLSARSGRIFRGRGAVARLFSDDGRRLELTARPSPRTFVAELTASVKLTAAQRTSLTRLGLTYDGNASGPGVTTRVRVYDWTKRRWRTVATLRNAGRDRTVRWSVASEASRYVSPSGVVRLSIRGSAPKGFRTRSDLLRLSTR